MKSLGSRPCSFCALRRLARRSSCRLARRSSSSSSSSLDWPLAPEPPALSGCLLSPHEADALLRLRTLADPDQPTHVSGPTHKELLTQRLGLHGETSAPLSINLGHDVIRRGLWLLPDGVSLVAAEEGAAPPRLPCVTWTDLAQAKKRGGAVHCSAGTAPRRIHDISETTGRAGTLVPLDKPSGGPPTVKLDNYYMHRMKRMTPHEDAADKLRALGRGLRGRTLDVCTGLGYTAIGAANQRAVSEVVTLELDPLMVRMQRANPWSAALFTHPKVSRRLGDAAALLPDAPSRSFDAVCHDPPSLEAAGELYSGAFYAELRRVLRRGGALYHYIGDPASRTAGRHFRGVLERLRSAGFDARTVPGAFGVSAIAR